MLTWAESGMPPLIENCKKIEVNGISCLVQWKVNMQHAWEFFYQIFI